MCFDDIYSDIFTLEMENKLSILLDRLPMACGIFDEDGNLLDCNITWQDNFGLTSREPDNLSRIFQEKLPSGYETKNNLKQCIQEAFHKGSSSTELVCNGPDDVLIYLHISFTPFSGKYLMACALDITKYQSVVLPDFIEKLQEEAQLAEAEVKRREAAEEESRAKTRFLARMSHEIRTPMNAVLGITEMQMQKEGLHPETEEAFSRIYSSSNMLLSIINDILDLSKVEAGKMEIIQDVYETASLIVDTVQLNLMQIGSKRIEFMLNVDEHVPSFLVGDEIRIKQIMNNILSNAFKYTDEGSVCLDMGIEEAAEGNVVLIFRVKDTGQGMTQEQMSRLFEFEYTRFNVQSNRSIEGSGLGMNIAYHLIGMMGGNIQVESKPGVGTTFTVRIPQHKDGDATLGKETVRNLQNLEVTQRALKRIVRLNHTPMPYGKVLVVDDVESNLYVARGLLLPYKLAIETVDSGIAAFEKVRAGNVYDIIFMDHMMPGLDGIEATKAIRNLGYDQPIVALTANTVLGQMEIFMNSGFSGVISKPIDTNQLNAYLLRLIRDKQPPEVLAAIAQENTQKQGSMASTQQETPEEISIRVRESFVRDAERSAEALENFLSQKHPESFKVYIIHTHALKSALSNVGESNMGVAAGVLEQAGREEDMDTIHALTPGFLLRLKSIVSFLSTYESSALLVDKKDKTVEKNRENKVGKENKKEDKVDKSDEIDKVNETIKTEKNNKDVNTINEEQTIFVVDDFDTNLILVEETLGDLYNVITMVSAERMFKLLKKIKPSLILLDIEMPVMDGFEAMEKLKADSAYESIPVVFVTGTLTNEIEARARSMGVAGIVTKPFAAENLKKQVRDWISRPGHKPSVLIIDDSPMVISALSKIIQPFYNVKLATNGEKGLNIAKKNPIDLILLDINMPGLSGFEVLEKLKEPIETRGIPVIFITSSEEAQDEAHGFSIGAVDYIKKPFVEDHVLHRVKLHIQGGKVL